MSTQPPPMPVSFAQENNKNTFAKAASLACLLSPFIIVGLAEGFTHGAKGITGPAMGIAMMVLGGLSCIIAMVGLILGILALALMKPGGRGRIAFCSVSGMAIMGLLVAIAIPNFARARATALAQAKTDKDIRDASNEYRSNSITALTNGESQQANLQHLEQSLGDAARSASGDEALALRATQTYARTIQGLQADYEQASADLNTARVLATSNLVEQSQIKDRKATVERFLQSNQALSDYLGHAAENYRSNLVAARVSDAAITQVMVGFEKTSAPQRPIVADIRAQDDKMGQAMLGALDLLETNWGHWHYNAKSTPHLTFDERAVLNQYNLFLSDIKDASLNQAASQRQLVAVMQNLPRQ